MSRRDGLSRLAVGLVVIPVYGLLLVALLLLAIPVWLVSTLFEIVLGRPPFGRNNRLGYAIYTSQANIQHAVSGRGRIEWIPV
jgi:hypothetical protein